MAKPAVFTTDEVGAVVSRLTMGRWSCTLRQGDVQHHHHGSGFVTPEKCILDVLGRLMAPEFFQEHYVCGLLLVADPNASPRVWAYSLAYAPKVRLPEVACEACDGKGRVVLFTSADDCERCFGCGSVRGGLPDGWKVL